MMAAGLLVMELNKTPEKLDAVETSTSNPVAVLVEAHVTSMLVTCTAAIAGLETMTPAKPFAGHSKEQRAKSNEHFWLVRIAKSKEIRLGVVVILVHPGIRVVGIAPTESGGAFHLKA